MVHHLSCRSYASYAKTSQQTKSSVTNQQKNCWIDPLFSFATAARRFFHDYTAFPILALWWRHHAICLWWHSENLWVRKWFTSSFTKSYCNYSKPCNVVDSNLLNAVFLFGSWRNRACWVEGNFELLWCGVMERCPYIIGFLTLITSLSSIQKCHKWGH